jgi:2,3-dihydroxybenzoate decarboxylase
MLVSRTSRNEPERRAKRLALRLWQAVRPAQERGQQSMQRREGDPIIGLLDRRNRASLSAGWSVRWPVLAHARPVPQAVADSFAVDECLALQQEKFMPIDEIPTPDHPGEPPMIRKIALEEHFGHPAGGSASGAELDLATQATTRGVDADWFRFMWQRLIEFEGPRLQRMDDAGIDVAILSLTSPGVQGLLDRDRAVGAAVEINDYLAEEVIARRPDRFAGFATVALQDPAEAADEARRAVAQLGLKGVMVNGYSNLGTVANGEYLDLPKFTVFWEAIAELGVPVYLHPRTAIDKTAYAGHLELLGATWGFTAEAATHALRLVYSGLFDRFPNVNVILGHLGETLPFLAWRIQHCFEYNPFDKKVQRPLQDYLADNFYVTTSGNFSDQALITALLTIGSDRILFSVDYPYERMDQAARWIERAPISEVDRRKITHGNSGQLFGLPTPEEARARGVAQGVSG